MQSMCSTIIALKSLVKMGEEAGLPAGQAGRRVKCSREGQWLHVAVEYLSSLHFLLVSELVFDCL